MRPGVHRVKRPRLALGAAAVAVLVMAVTGSGADVATASVNSPDVSSHNHDNFRSSSRSWLRLYGLDGSHAFIG